MPAGGWRGTRFENLRAPESLPRRAEQGAQKVMRSLHASEDWSQWHVSVHDRSGRCVLVQPFTPRAGELNQAA